MDNSNKIVLDPKTLLEYHQISLLSNLRLTPEFIHDISKIDLTILSRINSELLSSAGNTSTSSSSLPVIFPSPFVEAAQSTLQLETFSNPTLSASSSSSLSTSSALSVSGGVANRCTNDLGGVICVKKDQQSMSTCLLSLPQSQLSTVPTQSSLSCSSSVNKSCEKETEHNMTANREVTSLNEIDVCNLDTSPPIMTTSTTTTTIVEPSNGIILDQQHYHPEYLTDHYMTNDNLFGLEVVPKQRSPIGIFKIAKNEPSSSSNSQPSTPNQGDRRVVPACSICGTDSTGIHFGVDACAACSAFFRRTVVLNKQYLCNKGGQCTILKVNSDSSAGQKCRSCRYKKCITSGMDRNAVQHRRDAIGKYSTAVKREISPDSEQEPPLKIIYQSINEPCTSANGIAQTNVSSGPEKLRNQGFQQQGFPQFPSNSILHELINRQNFLTEQRHLFYSDKKLDDWFKKPPTLEQSQVNELTDFSNCMYHLWKVEPRLAADFINRNRFLDDIPERDKVHIHKNFVVVRQAVEEPFMTWKYGGLDKQWFVMPNKTYIDFNEPEKYFRNGALKNLKLDLETARNLFLPSFKGAMDSIGVLMRNIQVTETEIVILLGLVLLDPAIRGIQESTRQHLKNVRDQLIQETFMYLEDEEPSFDPEIRMADIFMLVAAIRIHAIKTAENMQLLRIFDLIPPDPCFTQILKNDVDSDEEINRINRYESLNAPTKNRKM